MKTTDEEIVSIILQHEGGDYTDDPDDPGGPTKWGITQSILSLYLRRDVTANDIRALSRDMAAKIYTEIFIRPFDRVADPLRVSAIDMGVNAGVFQSVILLQETIGALVDGVIGPKTIALSGTREWTPLYTGVRLGFYETLVHAKPKLIKYRSGWRSRAMVFYSATATSVRQMSKRSTLRNAPVFGFTGKAY
jgi:lysozyme family protein